MWPNPQFPADLVMFTEEICNGKLHFLCSESKVTDEDSAWKYTSKLLCKLKKEKKFTDKEYFEIYPSDPILPRLYGTVKG